MPVATAASFYPPPRGTALAAAPMTSSSVTAVRPPHETAHKMTSPCGGRSSLCCWILVQNILDYFPSTTFMLDSFPDFMMSSGGEANEWPIT